MRNAVMVAGAASERPVSAKDISSPAAALVSSTRAARPRRRQVDVLTLIRDVQVPSTLGGADDMDSVSSIMPSMFVNA